MPSTYIIGDTHGAFHAVKQWIDEYAEKGDTIISVGDFGSTAYPKRLEALGKRLDDAGVRCLVNRGNHSIPIFHQERRRFGNGALKFMSDYSVETVGSRTYLFLGGAVSVDRLQRVEGKNMWRGEEFQYNEEILKEVRGIDTIISHSVPLFAAPRPVGEGYFINHFVRQGDRNLKRDLIAEGSDLLNAYSILSENNVVKNFYAGHWHCTHRYDRRPTTFRILDIDEIVMANEGTSL